MNNPTTRQATIDALSHRARAACLACQDGVAADALRRLAELDASAACVLAAQLYGNAVAWLGPAFDERDG